MPTYEYECSKCRYIFEEFQNINDKPLKRCPKCKGNLRRLISGGAGLIFRGSGFYVTDYKKSQVPATTEKKSKDLATSKDKPPDITKAKNTTASSKDDTKKKS
jgi:putative FmdB family regulatory protein